MKGLKKLYELINNSKNIAIIGHDYIDGDSIGSCLGLGETLKKVGKKINYFTPTPPSETFSYLNNFNLFNTKFEPLNYDLIFFCDVPSKMQITKFYYGNEKYFNDITTIQIDHHISGEKFAKYYYLNFNKPSNCELIYDIIKKFRPDKIDSNIATALYTGIITDTNNFMNDNVNSNTLKIAKELLDYGAEKNTILNNIFFNNSYSGIKFSGKMIDRMIIKEKFLYTYYTDQEILQEGIKIEDAKETMNLLKTINNVEIYIILKYDGNSIKGSIRSRNNIAKNIAELFGGGGHLNASGFYLKTSKEFEIEIKSIIDKIEKFLNNKIN